MLQSRGAATLRQANSALGKAQGQTRALPIRHATILVQSQIGMKNLYNLVTASHLEYFHYKPRIPKSLLLKHREGLLIGSACSQGEVYRAVADGEPDDRLDAIGSFYDYLEIQPIANNLYMTVERPNLTKEMLMDYNRRIIQLGKRLGIPDVATGDVHHLEEKDAELRRILLNSMNYKNVAKPSPPCTLEPRRKCWTNLPIWTRSRPWRWWCARPGASRIRSRM